MSRSLSLTLRRAMHAQETGERLIFLVTIEHESLAEPLRYSSDPTERFSVDPLRWGTVSRGDSYIFAPMALQLPVEAEEASPNMQLQLENVTRQAIPLLRSVRTPASVTVELVLESDLDTVEATWPEFDLVAAPFGALQVTLDLSVNALAGAAYPIDTYTPAGFPGLF
jgi:hypothetical protein